MEFLINMGIRALKTFCQATVAAFGVGATIYEVDWHYAIGVGLFAAVASILTSLASLDEIGNPYWDTTDETYAINGFADDKKEDKS